MQKSPQITGHSSAKGRRKTPNGMYWCNILLSDGKGKIVLAEQISEKIFRTWSNSSRVKNDKNWQKSKIREGWYFRDLPENELTFFDY